jgi:predicted ATPase/DNA-binding CsgD family transcriptional regulator
MEPATLPLKPSRLPVYLTRFVGRELEQETLKSLLLNKRLLTLIGAGGIGKTRFALQIATEAATSFSDGVYLIELASLTEPQLVSQAIALALGIRTDQEQSLSSLLMVALQERHCILLLDNCEHVLSVCASLVEALLQACPHLHILATSREPFRITGETLWRVAPLSSPDSAQLPPFEQISQYESVQLFCERATDSDPHFHLTPQNAPAVAHICQQLDGLPLALELAAARLSILSVEQLAAHLEERFTLLTQGKRTAPARQQTLSAMLDWSYALLTPVEQTLFQRLAVFAGSWNIDAVEQIVYDLDSVPSFEVLAYLVNKSLVIAEVQENALSDSTEVRYRLLNTMQHYALEKLQQAGVWEQMCEQHYTCYLHLAEQASPHLQSADQLVWLQRLEVEMSNMRAALVRSLISGNTAGTAQLAEALRRFWITHNHFSEGRYWFDALVAAERKDARLSSASWVRVLFGAAEFARYQGAYDYACALLEEQIALLKTIDDPLGLAEAQCYLGSFFGFRGDYEQADRLCQASLAFYRAKGDKKGITTALIALAFSALAQNHYQQAIELSEETCQLVRAAGNHGYLMYCLFILGQATILQGELERSRAVCQEVLHLSQMLHQTFGVAVSLALIAGVAGLQGQPAQAARLFGAVHALQEHVQALLPPAGRALQERMALPVRTALGKEQFIAHYFAGQACSLEQIVVEAEAVLQNPSSASIDTSSPLSSASVFPIFAALSQREREVLTLVAMGLTDAQTAKQLVLSPRTVSKHLQSIYTKLNINSRSAATRLAIEHGLL